MYEYFQGELIEKDPHNVVLDIQGIGYKISIPSNLFEKLPLVGASLFLYVSWVIREMSHTLYGFRTKEERDLFELLLTLSGIGPKTALGIVGHFELPALEEAVRNEEAQVIAKVPGIGKKTAERLIVDLKGKLKISTLPKNKTSSSKIQDALNALLNLGCPPSSAEQAVKLALEELTEECDLPSLITAALQHQRRQRSH